jgi:sulfonate transport system permease protein
MAARAGRILRRVQFLRALPSIIAAAAQVAAPNAVLGAILAEFGGGGRWGLGAYLLGSLGRGEPGRLWAIGLVATADRGACPTASSRFSPLARSAPRARSR